MIPITIGLRLFNNIIYIIKFTLYIYIIKILYNIYIFDILPFIGFKFSEVSGACRIWKVRGKSKSVSRQHSGIKPEICDGAWISVALGTCLCGSHSERVRGCVGQFLEHYEQQNIDRGKILTTSLTSLIPYWQNIQNYKVGIWSNRLDHWQ